MTGQEFLETERWAALAGACGATLTTAGEWERRGHAFSAAIFSHDERYRYALARVWSWKLPPLVIIGMNPSTADHVQDDPTVKRCTIRAQHTGHGGLVMLNLFAYRANGPEEHAGPGGPGGAGE